MSSRLKTEWPKHLRQIQLITSESAEGVIMIDVNQRIKWANNAALAMHDVQSYAELGRTIDEYHANFQIKFRSTQQTAADRTVESVAAGETFRDVVIEVTPLAGNTPKWVYRVRNLVLVDEGDSPTCIVLVLRSMDAVIDRQEQFSAALSGLPLAAAIMRLEDRVFVRANDAFLSLMALDHESFAQSQVTAATLFGDAQMPALDGAGAGPVALAVPASQARDGNGFEMTGMPIDHAHQRCVLFTVAPNQGVAAAGPAHGVASDAAALCDMAPAPLFALNRHRVIVAASQPWLDWLGHRRDEVVGRNIADFMTPSTSLHFESHTWPELARDRGVRDLGCEFVSKSGAICDALVCAQATCDAGGAPVLVIASTVDVTERKRGEASFAAMFSFAPVPMLIRKLDDQRIMDVNDAFIAATGYTPAAVVGHSIDEFGIFENRAARQQVEAGMRCDTGLRNIEARLKTAHGEVLDCLLSARPIQAFGQGCVLMVLQDVSDRRRNETQLFQAIETVMEDTSWFSRSVIEKLATLRSPPRNGSRAAEMGDLTPREREVLGFISHGLADADIAQKLGLTRSTVRNHVATLYSKIGVHSRSSAIVWARERGINIAWPSAGTPAIVRTAMPSGKGGATALGAKLRRD